MHHIAPCYAYGDREDGESLPDYGARAAQSLEDEILRLGPDTVMAFLAEPVVGATLGAVTAVDGYFKRIRQICDQYGVLLILDEVMCGMGRTGHLFACEADGIAPDILCIAKGLGAGYQSIGAMMCSRQIYSAIAEGSGFFQHGHTYLGHPVATAAGLAVVKEILERGLVSQVQNRGAYFEAQLRDRFSQHPHIGDIRGRGLFWGLEFVQNRETKAPFDPKKTIAAKLKKAAFAQGLICYPMPGTRDGVHGDHVLPAPPFIATEDQLDGAIDMLDRAIQTVMADVT
jgi:adenosylmethionine-8-amino-7-oxononanoate aminotransferase